MEAFLYFYEQINKAQTIEDFVSLLKEINESQDLADNFKTQLNMNIHRHINAKAELINARAEAEAKAWKLSMGELFTPWPVVWDAHTLEKSSCKDTFERMCRASDYSQTVEEYKSILEWSERQDQSNFQEIVDMNVKGIRPKKGKQKKKDRVAMVASASNRQNRTPSSSGSLNSVSSRSVSRLSKTTASGNSNESQSMQFPSFSGSIPSTRAHMIPNPKTSDCYKYYVVLCKMILGNAIDGHGRLEKIVSKLADSKYNFLRAPIRHGDYFDNLPCWILVPACPLDSIIKWKADESYPVLAIANASGGKTTKEAYRMMCTNPYGSDSNPYDSDSKDEQSEKPKGYFRRSKCEKTEFEHATFNLKTMTLAMAETLVGKGNNIHPDESLKDTKLSNEDYDYIVAKLKSEIEGNDVKSKTEENDEEGEDDSGEDQSEKSRGTLGPKKYNYVQFQETRRSLNSGIKVPKMKEGLDFSKAELLQFTVDPNGGVDLYPDPMLLLIKAAINWSWSNGQKLLPTCGRTEEEEEWVAPIPTEIEIAPVPVIPRWNLLPKGIDTFY